MAGPIEDVLMVMAEIRRFVEHDFKLGLPGDVSDMSPLRKRALARWQCCYYAKINSPGQVVNCLIPLLGKCEATELSLLMSSENHLMKQMVELESIFDVIFEHLLDELNSLTCDVVVSAIGNNSTKEDKMKLKEYWSYL